MRSDLVARSEEEELDRKAIELFTKHETQFTPLHPWVLVRVLPREHRIGLIWTPDFQQNKPVHEGIVLRTWEPYWHEWQDKVDGKWLDRRKLIKSDFEIGDHVVYPHFAGMVPAGWDEKTYRVVPEATKQKRGIDWNGIIYGKLNYPSKTVAEAMTEELLHHDLYDEEIAGDMVAALLKKFDVVFKDKASKTLSGK